MAEWEIFSGYKIIRLSQIGTRGNIAVSSAHITYVEDRGIGGAKIGLVCGSAFLVSETYADILDCIGEEE